MSYCVCLSGNYCYFGIMVKFLVLVKFFFMFMCVLFMCVNLIGERGKLEWVISWNFLIFGFIIFKCYLFVYFFWELFFIGENFVYYVMR